MSHPNAKNEPDPARLRLAMERDLYAIQQLVAEREWASVEELNAWLNEQYRQGWSPTFQARTPLERAQELAWQAWEAESVDEQVRLARAALELSPDCADAYALLGDAADELDEAIRWYEQGVRAGERALGPHRFEEDAGHFWGQIETRPYMRVRWRLATALWDAGRRDEAIDHAQALLKLNPSDNQGVRYALVNWLLSTGRRDEAGRLLDAYGEKTAFWNYSRALLWFAQGGDTASARQALKDAIARNPHVVLLIAKLAAGEDLPDPPTAHGIGDESEALTYLHDGGLEAWRAVEGALLWLISVVDEIVADRRGRRRRQPKIGRNDPCPCGSGRKYKHCCLPR